jgi:hypothetical protein
VDFGSDYAYVDGYTPTYAELITDGNGVARVYLFLDWIPNDADGYSELESNVIGSIGYTSAEYLLTFTPEKASK